MPLKYRKQWKTYRNRYITVLRFSFTVFSKFGFGNIVSTNYSMIVIAQWVLGLLILAGFLYSLSNTSPILQALAFGTLFFVAAFPSGLVWLALGSLVHRLLRNERAARIFNVVMGLLLAASVSMILL